MSKWRKKSLWKNMKKSIKRNKKRKSKNKSNNQFYKLLARFKKLVSHTELKITNPANLKRNWDQFSQIWKNVIASLSKIKVEIRKRLYKKEIVWPRHSRASRRLLLLNTSKSLSIQIIRSICTMPSKTQKDNG